MSRRLSAIAIACGTVCVASGALRGHAADDRPGLKQALKEIDSGIATADISADGRFIAFESRAALSPTDVNRLVDIYVFDRTCDRVTLESHAPDGGAANGSSAHPRLSADGRYLVFESVATNIVEAASRPDTGQVFLSDRLTGTVRLLSRTPDGQPGNHGSRSPDISDDGRIVVFASGATNLVDGVDRNGLTTDIYAVETAHQTITRVSLTSEGVQLTTGGSVTPRVSGDGRFVAFVSRARLTAAVDENVAARETDRPYQVFVRDLRASRTHLVSRTSSGRAGNASSWGPAISADGHFVAYASLATNLTAHDRNARADVFLHDIWTSRTTLVSRTVAGTSANGSSTDPAMSADGGIVTFVSDADDLLCAGRGCPAERLDLNLVRDVYLADLRTGLMQRVSSESSAEPWWDASIGPALDAAGRLIVFSSRHPIERTDLSYDYDLIVRNLEATARTPRVAGDIQTCHVR